MSKPKYYKTKILGHEREYSLMDYLIGIGGVILLIWGLILLADIVVGVVMVIFGLTLIYGFLGKK